jgi:hypothetical protein
MVWQSWPSADDLAAGITFLGISSAVLALARMSQGGFLAVRCAWFIRYVCVL